MVVALPTAWAGWVLWRDGRAGDPAARPAVRRGLLVLALLWAQPVVSEAASRGENLRALWTSVLADTAQVGWSGTWRTVSWAFRAPPPFERFRILQTDDYLDHFGGLGPSGWLVAGALLALWAATRDRASTSERRLRALLVVTVVAAALTVPRLPAHDVRWYYLAWLGVVSTFVWIAVAEAAMRTLARWRPVPFRDVPRLARPAAVSLGILVLVWASSASTQGLQAYRDDRALLDRSAAELGPAALRSRHAGATLVLPLEQASDDVADSVTGELVADGREVRVEAAVGNYYGHRRVAGRGWTGPVLALVDGAPPSRPGRARPLARVEPDGWSATRFAAAAARLKSWAVAHGPIELTPAAWRGLPGYVGGWGRTLDCDRLVDLARGQASLTSLPAGAIARLYTEGGVARPLPPPSLAEALGVLRERPLELWSFPELSFPEAPSSALALRTGEQCPTDAFLRRSLGTPGP
jgi:hypothetical protein